MSRTADPPPAPLVLLAEAEAGPRAALAAALRREGFALVEAENGAGAIAAAGGTRPDLLLLDAALAGPDAPAVCRTLRADPGLAGMPIVVLTEATRADAVELAFEAGATDFATRPIAPGLLAHRLRFLLRATASADLLRRSEARLAEAQRIARLGNWEWDARTGAFLGSAEALRLLDAGGDPLRSLDAVADRLHPPDRELFLGLFRAVAETGEPLDREVRVPAADGSLRFLQFRGHPLRAADGALRRALGTVQDVTDRVHAEERIRTLAFYDVLTGLPNRILFMDQLRAAVSGARRRDRKVAVMLLDLDNFKEINDTLGHEAGDDVLRQVSARLRDVVRGYDSLGREPRAADGSTVGRMGGDEFMLAVVDLRAGDEAAVVARRLLEAFARPVRVGGGDLAVSASIGISVYPDDAVDIATLLRHADVALYQAKDAGRSTFEFFSDSMNDSAFHRMVLESSLRQALDRGEFAVHFQPQVDARDGRVLGVEALLRWTDPRLGPVAPDHFVPLAERVGLIAPLTDLALRRACEHAAAWGADAGSVSFNLSGHWFRRPDVVPHLAGLVTGAGLDPARFVLEVSESTLVDHAREAPRILHGLRDRGFRLAIDNFGAGYSSLAALRSLPLDYLKVARTFVHGLGSDPAAEAVCAAVLALARGLGLEPVAAGVEDEAQRDVLLRLGCVRMQGYLFGRPVPADRVRFGPAAALRD
jgi:diguanylate cyclase (GGDEF)-like protein